MNRVRSERSSLVWCFDDAGGGEDCTAGSQRRPSHVICTQQISQRLLAPREGASAFVSRSFIQVFSSDLLLISI